MEAVARLRQLLEAPPPRPVAERCGFCGELVAEAHAHVVDIQKRGLLCACRACYLLFTSPGAAQGRYRAVSDRYLHAAGLVLGPAQWDELQIPVGIAFFFYNSAQQKTVAFYPSPAGATESALPDRAWDEIARDNPVLTSLAPDTEALLVSRLPNHTDAFIVPIDACYELVGRIRRHWHGFGGGERVWAEIDAFFALLRERAG